jgi:lipid-A-disaccharide synthase-like uncharacterized protein
MNSLLIYGIGFTAQVLFFGRAILQWFKSEHERAVISPVIFWQLSLLASILMLVYGILRNDFAIVFGQLLVYFIYIRNLQLKQAWTSIPAIIRLSILAIPALIIFSLQFGQTYNFSSIIRNEDISLWLLIWGSAGMVVFTFRFIYQWLYSEIEKESVLPLGFWIISSTGSAMILVYSVFRLDPVLFFAHTFGIFFYLRNILLYMGKRSLFARLDWPFINRLARKLSEKFK